MTRFFTCLLFLFFSGSVFAQSVYAPLNRDYEHLIERYEIKYGRLSAVLHSHVKPYLRKNIIRLADSIEADNPSLSERDKFNLLYLRQDNWEWDTDSTDSDSRKPILKYFYRKKSDFIHTHTAHFDLHVNPVLYLGAGREPGVDTLNYLNSRGVEIRGMIDKKVGFYTFFTENQAFFPRYVRQRTITDQAIPNENYFRPFGDNSRSQTADFITTRGYITFSPTRHIQVQFGHDKNFIGNGYRSLILSDYAGNYLFLKLSTQVWRIKYTNIFAQMTATNQASAGKSYPKKFFTFHHLSTNLGKKLNIGLFEAIVSGLPDSLGGSRLNAEYLNPVIFYRSLELNTGSNAGNALLGLDFKYYFLRHMMLYGQLVLDEFKISEVRGGKGWWANKQAFQLGFKYIDAFGVPNLDIQGELNYIRPFTYTHESAFTNYTHYNQPLAHPIGANLRELAGILRYQPLNRLQITARLVYTQYGDALNGVNYGKNVLLSYNTRSQDFGYYTGNGLKTNLLYGDFLASFQVKHNCFLDFRQIIRQQQSEVSTQNTSVTTFSLRLNIAPREQVF
jgi:Capsule assembly protein Wzi